MKEKRDDFQNLRKCIIDSLRKSQIHIFYEIKQSMRNEATSHPMPWHYHINPFNPSTHKYADFTKLMWDLTCFFWNVWYIKNVERMEEEENMEEKEKEELPKDLFTCIDKILMVYVYLIYR